MLIERLFVQKCKIAVLLIPQKSYMSLSMCIVMSCMTQNTHKYSQILTNTHKYSQYSQYSQYETGFKLSSEQCTLCSALVLQCLLSIVHLVFPSTTGLPTELIHKLITISITSCYVMYM